MCKHIKFVQTYRKDLTHILYVIYLQLRLLKSCIKLFIHNYQDAPIWRGLTDNKYSYKPDMRHQFCSTAFAHRGEFMHVHTQKSEQLELPTSLTSSAIHHPKRYIRELGEEGAYNQSDLIITSAKNSQPSIPLQQEITFKKNTQKRHTLFNKTHLKYLMSRHW